MILTCLIVKTAFLLRFPKVLDVNDVPTEPLPIFLLQTTEQVVPLLNRQVDFR